jgi:hypothetical protein
MSEFRLLLGMSENLRLSRVPVTYHLSENLIKCHCAAVRHHPDESQIRDYYSGIEPPNSRYSTTVRRDLEISNMKPKRDCVVLYREGS